MLIDKGCQITVKQRKEVSFEASRIFNARRLFVIESEERARADLAGTIAIKDGATPMILNFKFACRVRIVS